MEKFLFNLLVIIAEVNKQELEDTERKVYQTRFNWSLQLYKRDPFCIDKK